MCVARCLPSFGCTLSAARNQCLQTIPQYNRKDVNSGSANDGPMKMAALLGNCSLSDSQSKVMASLLCFLARVFSHSQILLCALTSGVVSGLHVQRSFITSFSSVRGALNGSTTPPRSSCTFYPNTFLFSLCVGTAVNID